MIKYWFLKDFDELGLHAFQVLFNLRIFDNTCAKYGGWNELSYFCHHVDESVHCLFLYFLWNHCIGTWIDVFFFYCIVGHCSLLDTTNLKPPSWRRTQFSRLLRCSLPTSLQSAMKQRYGLLPSLPGDDIHNHFWDVIFMIPLIVIP